MSEPIRADQIDVDKIRKDGDDTKILAREAAQARVAKRRLRERVVGGNPSEDALAETERKALAAQEERMRQFRERRGR